MITKELTFVKQQILKGGPSNKSEVLAFHNWLNDTVKKIVLNEYSDVEIEQLKLAFSALHKTDGIFYLKPYGFSSDFEMIEAVYQNLIHPNTDPTDLEKYLTLDTLKN